MTVKEFYQITEGNYESVMKRIPSEAIVLRFINKFPEDKSYSILTQAMAEGVREDAFRAAHTLKGVCLNLAFDKLAASADRLTECLRHEWHPEEANELYREFAAEYETVVENIRLLANA